ncbi:RNase P subunit p30-domain-containing protein [Dunaliella salina]|uniref:RNase P subunit p30-domain-containing protein n=1 Tax=Dunaliella salina TaxID=3046 RepID=A0ABZ3LGI0_DUNSA|nr:RNase P subunit p30-domain-containing protein [Dunaliella salina]|eukprot:KAF5840528.1 RNase P subunit p30-domain-containing protein [Dunaliella salina]
MHQACHWLDVEIISLDLGQKLPFRLRPKLLAAATARGVMFEVCYSGGLHDSSSRQMLISNVQALVRALNGRGLILSSGACSALELRSPAAATALLAVMAGHACSRVNSSTPSMTSLHSSIACNARTAIARGQARKDGSLLKLHQLQLQQQQPQLGLQGGEALLQPPQFLPLSHVPQTLAAGKNGSACIGGTSVGGDGVCLEQGGGEQSTGQGGGEHSRGQGTLKRPRKRGGQKRRKKVVPTEDK